MEGYPTQHGQRLLRTDEIAQWLGVACRTVCSWAECGELPALKIGRQWRFRQTQIAEWITLQDHRIPKISSLPNRIK